MKSSEPATKRSLSVSIDDAAARPSLVRMVPRPHCREWRKRLSWSLARRSRPVSLSSYPSDPCFSKYFFTCVLLRFKNRRAPLGPPAAASDEDDDEAASTLFESPPKMCPPKPVDPLSVRYRSAYTWGPTTLASSVTSLRSLEVSPMSSKQTCGWTSHTMVSSHTPGPCEPAFAGVFRTWPGTNCTRKRLSGRLVLSYGTLRARDLYREALLPVFLALAFEAFDFFLLPFLPFDDDAALASISSFSFLNSICSLDVESDSLSSQMTAACFMSADRSLSRVNIMYDAVEAPIRVRQISSNAAFSILPDIRSSTCPRNT
mmetsp:Transcript_50007/g.120432  ORF Transcript_50007/g.120432 Transcript_50007/m.120432 type:complete len:317 (-) Transcript_50007:25-975(-)